MFNDKQGTLRANPIPLFWRFGVLAVNLPIAQRAQGRGRVVSGSPCAGLAECSGLRETAVCPLTHRLKFDH